MALTFEEASKESDDALRSEWRRLINKWRAMGVKNVVSEHDIPEDLRSVMKEDLAAYNALVEKWRWYKHSFHRKG